MAIGKKAAQKNGGELGFKCESLNIL